MTRIRLRLVVAALCGLVICGAATPAAKAEFRLTLRDLSTGQGVVITDNGAGDIVSGSNGVGVISYIGSVGGFMINITTGFSFPPLPTAFVPNAYSAIDLRSVNVNVSGPGQLLIALENTDFQGGSPGPMTLQSNFGGTLWAKAGTNVAFQSWADPNNGVPDFGPDRPTSGPLGEMGPPPPSSAAVFPNGGAVVGNGSFGRSGSTTFENTGTYSLFSSVLISFTGPGFVSFDQSTSTTQTTLTTPAPAGAALAVSGMIAFGLYRWRGTRSRPVPA
jgi:hypothetical protein